MTEFALDGNQAGIDRSLKAYSHQSMRVDGVLSTSQRVRLHARTAAIAKTRRTADFAGVAMNAVEAYGVLVQALRPERLTVPVEVARLDYAGFKLKVLMQQGTSDWPSARVVARNASMDWSAIRKRVRDPSLQDAMDVDIAGMRRATAAGNRDMARFSADVDLALVDLLETYFEGSRRSSALPAAGQGGAEGQP
ncbi:MAG: hypothetical protein LH470_02980 [Lysobacter sp.]|nr:hypothetical protein [Lysobacter sp.]